MQLDDPDEYEGGVGISIMSQRRASLHPFDGPHPNGMHHHVRSHSDQGPNGNTRLTGAYGVGNGRLGPSSFSSLSSSSSTGKLRSLVDSGRIAPPSHNFPAARAILPFSSSSSASSMKIPRISRSTASDSPSPAHSSPSSASTTGARTPTGLSSGEAAQVQHPLGGAHRALSYLAQLDEMLPPSGCAVDCHSIVA